MVAWVVGETKSNVNNNLMSLLKHKIYLVNIITDQTIQNASSIRTKWRLQDFEIYIHPKSAINRNKKIQN